MIMIDINGLHHHVIITPVLKSEIDLRNANTGTHLFGNLLMEELLISCFFNARLQVLDEQLCPVVRVYQVLYFGTILAAQLDDFVFAREIRCFFRSDLLVMVVIRHDCI